MIEIICWISIIIALLFVILIYELIVGFKALKRARQVKAASKCPYFIDKEENMAELHKKITITIPKELDIVLNALIKESKNTARPLNKSKLFVVAMYDYLATANEILKAKNKEEKN